MGTTKLLQSRVLSPVVERRNTYLRLDPKVARTALMTMLIVALMTLIMPTTVMNFDGYADGHDGAQDDVWVCTRALGGAFASVTSTAGCLSVTCGECMWG